MQLFLNAWWFEIHCTDSGIICPKINLRYGRRKNKIRTLHQCDKPFSVNIDAFIKKVIKKQGVIVTV